LESYRGPWGEDSQLRGLDDMTATARRVAKSTGEALKELDTGEDQLQLSKKVTETAQRVAKSTEKELERVRRKKHEELQSLKPSDQLTATAQRIAWSTGEMVKKVKMAQQDEKRNGHDSLKEVKETAQRVAKSTGEAVQKVSNTGQPAVSGALKQVELTAKRIAESTSSALDTVARGGERETSSFKLVPPDKLGSTSSHTLHSHGSFEDTTRNYSHSGREHSSIQLPSLPFNGPRETELSYGGHARHNGIVPYQTNLVKKTKKKKKPTDSDSTSSEFSTTESLETPPGYWSRSLVAHRQSVAHDPDLAESPLQRMTHTAELVAASTGQAVIKLTSSLLP